MKDGGPAFPETMSVDDNGQTATINGNQNTPIYIASVGGMTLRDYFAAHAMAALVTEGLRLDHKSWDATAEHSYIIADAMLHERERKR